MLRPYLIGSGCFYCESGRVPHHTRESGDYAVHRPSFFSDYWLKCVDRFTKPSEILIVDAHSPAIPDIPKGNSVPILWYRRADNLGHRMGWQDSVKIGAEYALWKGLDFVYIEQDCLLWGNRIIDFCRSKMTKGLMIGSGEGISMPIEQSFFIVKYDFLPDFLKVAGKIENVMGELKWIKSFEGQYDFLPFRGGRQRPLNFESRFGYIQHLNLREIKKLEQKIQGTERVKMSVKETNHRIESATRPQESIFLKAKKIAGWHRREELELLWKVASLAPAGIFLEIGVYCGRSASILANFREGENLVLFDDLSASGANQSTWPSNAVSISDRRKLPRRELSLLHIDANHFEDAVLRDLRVADQIKAGGFLALHDFHSGSSHPGVRSAWAKYPNRSNFLNFGAKGSLQVFRRKSEEKGRLPKMELSVPIASTEKISEEISEPPNSQIEGSKETVGILITNFNREQWVKAWIRILRSFESPYFICVIDNGGHTFPEADVSVSLKHNPGLYEGDAEMMDIGFQIFELKSEINYIFKTSADTWIAKDEILRDLVQRLKNSSGKSFLGTHWGLMTQYATDFFLIERQFAAQVFPLNYKYHSKGGFPENAVFKRVPKEKFWLLKEREPISAIDPNTGKRNRRYEIPSLAMMLYHDFAKNIETAIRFNPSLKRVLRAS
jgi:hypothetical protein